MTVSAKQQANSTHTGLGGGSTHQLTPTTTLAVVDLPFLGVRLLIATVVVAAVHLLLFVGRGKNVVVGVVSTAAAAEAILQGVAWVLETVPVHVFRGDPRSLWPGRSVTVVIDSGLDDVGDPGLWVGVPDVSKVCRWWQDGFVRTVAADGDDLVIAADVFLVVTASLPELLHDVLDAWIVDVSVESAGELGPVIASHNDSECPGVVAVVELASAVDG